VRVFWLAVAAAVSVAAPAKAQSTAELWGELKRALEAARPEALFGGVTTYSLAGEPCRSVLTVRRAARGQEPAASGSAAMDWKRQRRAYVEVGQPNSTVVLNGGATALEMDSLEGADLVARLANELRRRCQISEAEEGAPPAAPTVTGGEAWRGLVAELEAVRLAFDGGAVRTLSLSHNAAERVCEPSLLSVVRGGPEDGVPDATLTYWRLAGVKAEAKPHFSGRPGVEFGEHSLVLDTPERATRVAGFINQLAARCGAAAG